MRLGLGVIGIFALGVCRGCVLGIFSGMGMCGWNDWYHGCSFGGIVSTEIWVEWLSRLFIMGI